MNFSKFQILNSIFLTCIGFAFFTFSFLLLPSSVSAATINKPTNYLGMVGYWPFDGNDVTDKVYDRSGNGNHGGFYGGSTSSAKTIGKVGQALTFDGTDDYVQQSSALGLTAYPFTLSAWIKTTTGTSTLAIISTFNDTTSSNIFKSIGIEDGKANLYISNASRFIADTPINDGKWHHVVGVFTSDTSKDIYVDGVKDRTTIGTSSVFNPTLDIFCVGRACDSTPSSYFPGSVDETRVYNRALSASEILRLYNNTSGSKANASKNTSLTNGLVGLWSFDGNDVTDKVYDRSSQGNHGGFLGGATSSAKVLGTLGQALTFDGIDDYIDLGTGSRSVLNGSRTATVAFWIKTATTTQVVPIGTYDGSGDEGFEIVINKGSVTDAGKINFFSFSNFFVAENYYTTSDTSVTDNNWHHIVVTWEIFAGTVPNVSLFFDGVSQALTAQSNASVPAYTTFDQNIYIGARNNVGSPNAPFPGLLDDVRIYNRVLTAGEAKQLYNMGGSIANASQNKKSTNGLVGLWSFDGADVTDKVYDRSGQNNHGTFVGGATSSAKIIGKIGQALTFDGVDDVIKVPDHNSLDFGTGNFTVSLWVKAGFINTTNKIFVSKKVTTGAPNAGFLFDLEDCGRPGISDEFEWFIADGTTEVVGFENKGIGSICNNQWHHITYVVNRTAGTLNRYLDGVVGTQTDISTVTGSIDNTAQLCIGSFTSTCNAGASTAWNGSLDDVRIYNRVLPASEVLQLYNQGK